MGIDQGYVIGPVDYLRVYRRDEKYVVYNPTVPTWVYTNSIGAIALKLIDGKRSVGAIAEISDANGVDGRSVVRFLIGAHEEGLFEVGAKSNRWSNTGYFKKRRIESIYLHLTNKCNLSCGYCYRNSSPKITIKKFGEEFINFLQQAKPIISDGAQITFSGGEPMMHPDFFAVSDFTKSQGWSNGLLTNGTFVNEENCLRVLNNFKYVKISLDGPNEATHSQTRGEGNFDIALNALRLLGQNSTSTKIEAQMTVSKNNIDTASQIKSILPPNVEMKYTPMLPMGRGLLESDDNRISSSDFYGVHELVGDFDTNGVSKVIPGQRTHGCYAGDAHISVSDTGDIYPCHHFHKPQFRMGNIFNDQIEEIFFGNEIVEFASTMDVETNNQRCGSCDFRYLCGGGCKANPLHSSGTYRASDTYCGFIRKTLLDELFNGHPMKQTDNVVV